MNFKIFASLSFCLFSFFSLFGQSSDQTQKVSALFESPNDLKWLKHFKGHLNDYNEVAVILGYDGFQCKGIMKYLRSGQELHLEGVLEKENLILQESDIHKKITGYIKGKFVQNTFKGSWNNFDNTIGYSLVFNLTQAKNLLPTYCGKNNWIKQYTAVSKKDKIQLSLQKLQGESISGTLYLKKENVTRRVKGEWSKKSGLNLKITDYSGNSVGSLIASKTTEKAFKGTLKLESKKTKTFQFSLTNQLNIGCIEYADFNGMYNILYPKTTSRNFNNQIEKLVSEEIDKFNNRTLKASARISSLEPENRANFRSDGWFEVGFFDENLITGILIMQSTITKQQRVIPINYDLQKEQRIRFENVFREEYDLNYFQENIIRKELTKHRLYQEDSQFKKGLRKMQFPHIILLRDGIHFSSNFDAVYGRQGVTIPYNQLKSFLRKDFDFSFRK